MALAPRDHGLKAQTVAAFEFLLGAAIVIGHNVFRIVPNEVPLLVGLGLLSNRFWTGSWQVASLRRPSSWPRVLGIAVAAAVYFGWQS